MAPTQTALFSPSELSYLHTSLSLSSPVRPDARSPFTFRPLRAETDLLPSTNGSARLCFADGSEAIVGVKGEVQKSSLRRAVKDDSGVKQDEVMRDVGVKSQEKLGHDVDHSTGESSWIEVTIDMPGQRDDDNTVVFLGQMIHEGLVADGTLTRRLYINDGWHWKLFIDILLLSAPQSYPLPLLSLTTHLALLSTHLPALISSGGEDPLFDDDWDAALPLYTTYTDVSGSGDDMPGVSSKPPVVLLVIAVADNIFFDPSREELAVADAVIAVTIAPAGKGELQVLAVRTVNPPSRLAASTGEVEEEGDGIWTPRKGGVGRKVLARMVLKCVEKGGVGEEVLTGLGELG